jgi:hypothetical protein
MSMATTTAPRPRRIGDLLGWSDNPLYQVFDANRHAISGAATGALGNPRNPWAGAGAGMMAGGRIDDEVNSLRDEEAKRQEMIARYAGILREMGPEYEPFAQGVEMGAVEPADAWGQAIQHQMDAKARSEALGIARNNAQFIQDPTLRQMVESGAMDFEQAYQYEREGAQGGMPGLGTTVYPGRDDQGNIVPMQVGDNGQFYQTQLPEGVTFDPGAFNAERAAGTVIGRGAGQASMDLPAAAEEVQRISMQIEDLKNHPGLGEMFGGLWGTPFPNQWAPTLPNTNKANAMARVEQMSGNAFLSGRQMLKGGGAITDFESRKAEAAFARLSTAQSKEEFILALDEFQQAVTAGYEKLQAQAGATQISGSAPAGGMPGGPVAVNPQTGERVVWDGSNWVPAQ